MKKKIKRKRFRTKVVYCSDEQLKEKKDRFKEQVSKIDSLDEVISVDETGFSNMGNSFWGWVVDKNQSTVMKVKKQLRNSCAMGITTTAHIIFVYKISEKNERHIKKVYVTNYNKMQDIFEYLKLKPKPSSFQYNQKFKDKLYIDKVFADSNDDTINNLQISIELVKDDAQTDLWHFYRTRMSSVPYKNRPDIKVLVANHDQYIGIIALSSLNYSNDSIDAFVGWGDALTKSRLKFVAEVTCCVGLQPFSYNYNVGKLLVGVCFCEEVAEFYNEKFGNYPLCFIAKSLYGKSVQYDRIPRYLKYVDETQINITTVQDGIDETLYDMCAKFLLTIDDTYKMIGGDKRAVIKKVFEHLNIYTEQGVYIGMVDSKVREFLRGQNELEIDYEKLDDVVDWWKIRWATKRYDHIKSQGKLRYNREIIKDFRNVEEKVELVKEDKVPKGLKIEKIRIEDVPVIELDPEHLAGFVDGDGSFQIIYQKKEDYTICRIEMPQCRPEILIHLQRKFGGNINNTDSDENQRTLYKFILSGEGCLPFLEFVKDYVIIEADKTQIMIQHIQALRKSDKRKMIDLYTKYKKLSKATQANRPYNRISWKYISGFLDAEGYVSIRLREKNNKMVLDPEINITQKLDTVLLNKCREFAGYGICDDKRYRLYSKQNILNMIKNILPSTIVKTYQLNLMRTLLTNKDLNQDEQESMIQSLNDNKHISMEIDKDSVNNANAKGKRYVKQVKADRGETVEKLEHKENLRQDASDRMKGEKNPNFNKERPEEHALGIAMGVQMAKLKSRKITDANIDAIRAFKLKGFSNTKIVKEVGLSRYHVDGVVNKTILKSTEINEESLKARRELKIEKKKPVENVNKGAINKRKLQAQEIIDIMKIKIQNSTMVPREAKEKFYKTENKISMDMIKNYWDGSSRMYEGEFPVGDFTWVMFNEFKDRFHTRNLNDEAE